MASSSHGRIPVAAKALEALRQHFSDLVRVLQDPVLLASDLYAEGVVLRNAVEEVSVLGIPATQKRVKLLSLVEDQIAVNPATFNVFLRVLKKQPPSVELAERLERTYLSLCAQQSEPTPTQHSESTPTQHSEPSQTQHSEPTPTQHSEPTPTQYSEPTPIQHSKPTPTQHSEPTPTQHSEPTPTQHSEPTPTQYSEPTPIQHSKPTPTQHSEPTPTQHSVPTPTQQSEPTATQPSVPSLTQRAKSVPTQQVETSPTKLFEPAPNLESSPTQQSEPAPSRHSLGKNRRMICDNVALQPTKKRRHESSEASDHSVASPSATSEPTATQQSEPALNQQSKSNPNHHSEPSLASPSAIEQYASYLKSVYIKQKPPMYDKLPQIEVRKYIKLALIGKDDITPEEADEFTLSTMHGSIHDITRKKQPITFDQIAQLEDGSEPKGILIDGAPGIGKSTFSWKLCRKWGKGKILQQYQLLVMLRLRDNRVRRATDVLHLFRHPDMGTQEAAAKEIVRRRGKGLLLLLEGFDELPADLRSEDSLFMRIITGVELPEATVMITSRPSASGLLLATCRDDISQHIEIIGFTPDDVQCYIRTAFEDNPSLQSGLQEYLSCYPHMKSMMYVPLNCAIVTQVYKNSIKDRFIPKTMSGLYIPKTMSDLYTSLVRSLLLCYLHEHPVHGRKVWRLRSFSELPHDVFHQLRELGRIAHEGIVQGQQVIFSDLPSDFDGLGLMQSMNELYVDEGSTVSFSFFHLTLQEFLAALHLSEQPIESQIKSFQEYGSKVHNRFLYGHFQITLQFLAGLGKFAGYPTDRIRSIFSNSESTSELQITLDGLHWIFEAQGSSSICEAIGVSKVSPLLHYRRLSPFDCFVLGYCVCHTDCPWKIDLEDCGIGDKGVEMLVRGTQEIEPCRSGYISVLGLKHNQITSSGLNQLMNSPTLLKLDELQLGLNLLGNGGAAPLLSSRLGHSIKHLNLHTTGIGVEDCRALGELLSSYSTLEHLDISTNDLTSETVQLLFSGIQHTSALKWLSLDFNPLGNGGAVPLLKSRVAHNLSCLRLRDTGIGEEDCRALCSLLLASTSLQWIDISNNDLPSVAMQLIVSGLQDNTTVNNLYVMKNSLDSEAAVSLLKSPLAHRLHHFSLTVTGVEDCRALGELLTTPQKLQFLDISAGSGLPPEAMELIITGLQNNTKLKRLRVWDFHFSLQNCISLASVLRNHRLLFALWLQHCSIDDADGASELASSLFRNDTLQIFRLSHTPIGIKGACAFAEMLHHNNYLEDLNLSQVSIDVEGTQKLIESLSHNATLLRLALPSKYKSSVNTSEAYKKERDRIRWK